MTQEEALRILKTGLNIFLTGSAGSGKTYVLNKYIEYLHNHNISVAVTASTGIAATHMGGMTIHSWSGIGIKDYLSPYDLDKIEHNKKLWERINETKVLIIDEVSMLDSTRLDMVDQVCKAVKRNQLPFGGIQVVFSGDFFQLPPVTRTTEEVAFAFQARSWNEGEIQTCYLHTQYRQHDDLYAMMLNEIRNNSVTEETMNHFRSRYKKDLSSEIEPTRLYSRNINVDALNKERLNRIDGHVYSYEMTSFGKKNLVDNLKKNCLAPERLELKKEAIVMFVKNNYEKGYVNGTVGKVEDFIIKDGHHIPCVRTILGKQVIPGYEEWSYDDEGKKKAAITQLPLRLAWAITIHKSQGMSLDCAEVDLSDAFVPGQGYVALSRVRSLDGLKLMGLNEKALQVDERVFEKDQSFQQHSEHISLEFKKFDDENITELHEDFITRSGGSLTITEKSHDALIEMSTYEITKTFVDRKIPLGDIAEERGFAPKTILGHLDTIKELFPETDFSYLIPQSVNIEEIIEAFRSTEEKKLKPVKELFGEKYSYDDIQLVRLLL